MGSYLFQWLSPATEVFVTGTFDDWGKTVKLDRVGDGFAKEVPLPVGEKVQYKFVVDGIWTTDSRVRQESDGHNNINNVLLPEDIQPQNTEETSTQALPSSTATDATTTSIPNADNPTIAKTMSGVTPDSTTAALAANVPKEHPNGNLPGTFPDTPGQESEPTLSVNPIPASGGYGNPIKLNPGEKVPDPSSIHGNTIESTVKLDKESYEKGDSVPLGSAGTQSDTAGSSAFTVPPVTKNLIPESSLPMGGPAQRAAQVDQEPTHAGGPAQQAALADPGYTIQSAAPTSTTADLAAKVPLEKDIKQPNGTEPAKDVPQIVKESIAEADSAPEAAANTEAVEEKKEMENELQKKVNVDDSAGTPAPTTTAATQAVAPGLTVPAVDSTDVSPTSTPPPGHAAPTSAAPTSQPTGPTVTSGISTEPTPEVSTAKPVEPAQQSANTTGAGDAHVKEEKKKKRLSGFFSKLKEKLK